MSAQDGSSVNYGFTAISSTGRAYYVYADKNPVKAIKKILKNESCIAVYQMDTQKELVEWLSKQVLGETPSKNGNEIQLNLDTMFKKIDEEDLCPHDIGLADCDTYGKILTCCNIDCYECRQNAINKLKENV